VALYEPQALHFLARRALTFDWEEIRLSSLLDHPRTAVLSPPETLASWMDVNAPDELRSPPTKGIPCIGLQEKRR
jgi:hypothetical protein